MSNDASANQENASAGSHTAGVSMRRPRPSAYLSDDAVADMLLRYWDLKPPVHPRHENSISGGAMLENPFEDLAYLMSRGEILRTVKNAHNTIMQCEDPDLRESALSLMPKATLFKKARENVDSASRNENTVPGVPSLNVTFDEALVKVLLKWFKEEFFSWVDILPCVPCANSGYTEKTTTVEPGMATAAENAMGVFIVEMHICQRCGHYQRFLRHTRLEMLLSERRGRCGEWAACFALFLRALGYEVRIVHDFADHVWNEVFLSRRPSKSATFNSGILKSSRSPFFDAQFVHVDSCEGLLDAPYVYALGWGKKLKQVIATHRLHSSDVTERYVPKNLLSTDFDVEAPRLRRALRYICASHSRTEMNPQRLLDSLLIAAYDDEALGRCSAENFSGGDESYSGRTSGSLGWRLARGETSLQPGYASLLAELTNVPEKRWNILIPFAKPLEGKSKLIGSASTPFDPRCGVTLTQDKSDECGAFWAPLSLSKEASFSLIFTAKVERGGADGFAVVIQAHSDQALGNGGSGLGYDGIPRSVAIEFDTYYSANCGDPDNNHVSVHTRGMKENSSEHSASIACTPLHFHIASGKHFLTRVTYLADMHKLIVECEERYKYGASTNLSLNENWDHVLAADIDLLTALGLSTSGKNNIWIGFTAATGGLRQEHLISAATLLVSEQPFWN